MEQDMEQELIKKIRRINTTIEKLKKLGDKGVTEFKETQNKLMDEYVKYTLCLDIIKNN